MMEQEFADIRRRAERATAGPWTFQIVKKGAIPDDSVMIAAVAPGHQIRARPPGGSFPSADGEFIAHAREDVPYLLTLVTAQEYKVAQRDELLTLLRRIVVRDGLNDNQWFWLHDCQELLARIDQSRL